MSTDMGTAGILFLVALVMALFLSLVALIMPKKAGMAVSITAENIIGMVAFSLAFASVLISINFPLSLADSAFLKFVLLLMFIGFVFIQYSVSFWLTAFWASGAIPMIFAGLYLMLATVAISIMAGQSFLADMTAAKEKELREGSDKYKAALEQRKQAANTAAKLAVSDETASNAKAQLETLQRQLTSYEQSQAVNSRGVNAGTVASAISKYGCSGHYSTYCTEVARLKNEMTAHRAKLYDWEKYQGAKSHSESLQATPLPSGQIDAQIPGFRALAEFINVPYEKVRDNFWIGVSFFTETAAQLCFIFLGWNRRRRGIGFARGVDITQEPESYARAQSEQGIVDKFAEGFGRGAAQVAAAGSPSRFVPGQQQHVFFCLACGNPWQANQHQECVHCGSMNAGTAKQYALRNSVRIPEQGPTPAQQREPQAKHAHTVEYRDRERVPAELSQVSGKGRVGRVDSCKDCGVDYLIETYNATRCKSCSEKAADSYRKAKARRA